MTITDSRKGYITEHRFSQIQIVDETEKQREYPDHNVCIGPLKVWREDVIPQQNGKDKKVTYYKLNKVKLDGCKENMFVALLTDYDQNLSSLSLNITKADADPASQKLINNVVLGLSMILNIFLVVQDSLNPDDPLVIEITLANAGWLLFMFALFRLVNTMQQRPAVTAGLYVLYWASIYNPSEEQMVEVAFCRILFSDKIRISDHLPVDIEQEHVLAHSALRQKAEEKFEQEVIEKLQLQRTSADQKMTIQEFEKRLKAKEKEAYVNGLRDGAHSISVRSTADTVRKYPNIFMPLALVVAAVIFYYTVSQLSLSFPDAVFIVDIAQFPMIFWVLLFVLSFFFIRGFYQLLGVYR